MRNGKASLRKKFILLRKKNFTKKKFLNFNSILNLIKKHFSKKKIIIAAYYPSNYEADLLKFIELVSKRKYRIVLPVIESKKKMSFRLWKYKEPLYLNNFGIMEPRYSNQKLIPDLILVPLVAYDEKFNRIGYGKGYYDRSLKKIKKNKKNMISLGIAYSFQKSSNIPVNKYDYKLDYIFTERGIISSKY